MEKQEEQDMDNEQDKCYDELYKVENHCQQHDVWVKRSGRAQHFNTLHYMAIVQIGKNARPYIKTRVGVSIPLL